MAFLKRKLRIEIKGPLWIGLGSRFGFELDDDGYARQEVTELPARFDVPGDAEKWERVSGRGLFTEQLGGRLVFAAPLAEPVELKPGMTIELAIDESSDVDIEIL